MLREVPGVTETTKTMSAGPVGGAVIDVVEFERLYACYSVARDEAEMLTASGEAESSLEQVEERHRGLCTPEALVQLRQAAKSAASASDRRRADLLATACASGIADRELAPAADQLLNSLAGAMLEFEGETIGLFEAMGRLPALDDFDGRERLARAVEDCMAAFEPLKADWHRRYDAVWAQVTGEPDPVLRAERRRGISLDALKQALDRAVAANGDLYKHGCRTLLPRLLGADFEEPPISAQGAYASNLRGIRAAAEQEVDLVHAVSETLARAGFDLADSGIRCDLEARPGKQPRACMFPLDPPRDVRLQALPSGGLLDFVALLHECGHAFHFAGVSPELPFALRKLSPDYALTETYATLFEHIAHDPLWHQQTFGLAEDQARERAAALAFTDLIMFRRFVAKLRYEALLLRDLDDLDARKADYTHLLSEATGLLYREQRALFDVDDGFYAADYLRAYLSAAQLQEWLEAHGGRPWWDSAGSAALLGDLFALGSSPTLEEVSRTIGFEQFDPEPLVRKQQAPFA